MLTDGLKGWFNPRYHSIWTLLPADWHLNSAGWPMYNSKYLGETLTLGLEGVLAKKNIYYLQINYNRILIAMIKAKIIMKLIVTHVIKF